MVEIRNEKNEKVDYIFNNREVDGIVNYIKNTEKKRVKVRINVEGDIRKGGVYMAVIKGLDNRYKFKRQFMEGVKFYNRKNNILYIDFNLELETGDLVEIGEGGSWKNRYRTYYVVTERGLELLSPPYADGEKFIWEVIRKLEGQI
jgi:hypothetical protein